MKSTDQRRQKTDLNCSTDERICNSSVSSTSKSANINHEESFGILYHYLLIGIIFMFLSTEYSIGESSKPLNRAAIKGEQVRLNCSTEEEDNGYWKYAKPFQRQERLYDGDKVVNGFQTMYSVDDSKKGHFNLLFNSSDETSGTYLCEPDVHAPEQSAEVIVLDEQPVCSKTMTSDGVNARCSINFSGKWAPEIEWRFMNGKLEVNETATIPNSRVSSSVIVPISEAYPGESHILTCTPTFRIESKPSDTTATNVPEFPNSCTLTIGSSSTEAPTTQPTSSHAPPPPQSPPLYIIGIFVCIIACVVATFFTVKLYKRRCKKIRKEEHPPKNQKEEHSVSKSMIKDGDNNHA